MDRQATPAKSVESDPTATFAARLRCNAALAASRRFPTVNRRIRETNTASLCKIARSQIRQGLLFHLRWKSRGVAHTFKSLRNVQHLREHGRRNRSVIPGYVLFARNCTGAMNRGSSQHHISTRVSPQNRSPQFRPITSSGNLAMLAAMRRASGPPIAYSSDREHSFHAMVNSAWRGQLETGVLRQVFTIRQASV